MADESYQIGIDIKAETSGASEAVAALEDVKRAAGEAGTAVSSVGDSVAGGGGLREVVQPAREAKTSLDELAKNDYLRNNAGREIAQQSEVAAGGIWQATDSVKGLVAQIASGGTSISGWINSLKSITANAGGAAGAVTGLASAIAIAVGAIALTVKASEKFAEWLADITHDAVDASGALRKLENSRLDFEDQQKAAEDLASKLESARKKSVELQESISKLDDAKADVEIKRLDLAEKKELAAAGDDETPKAAIRVKYDAQRADVSGRREEEAATQRLTPIKEELSKLEMDRVTLTKALAKHTERAERAESTIADAAVELRMTFTDALRLGQSSEKLQKAMDDAAAAGDELKTAMLAQLKEFVPIFRQSRPAQEDTERKLGDIDADIQRKRVDVETGERQIESARLSREGSKIDLGQESVTALRGLQDALLKAQADQAAASARLTAAQARGGAVEQGAAFADIQAAQARIAEIKTLIADTSRNLAAAGVEVSNATVAFGRDVNAAATGVAADMTAAAGEVKATATAGVQDVKTAAGEVTKATVDASSEMSGAVRELSQAVVGQIQSLSNSLTNALQGVRNEVTNLSARVTVTESAAAAANASASLALSQIRNR